MIAQIMNDYMPPDELMPPATGWECTVIGFDDHALTKRMADAVGGIIKAVLMNGFDLSHLEGTTISARYTESLAELDRGSDLLAPLAPSQEHGVGMAMAAPVLRDGKPMQRLMLDASIGLALLSNVEEERSFGTCYVVHELAHICDLANKEKAFPNTFLRPYPGTRLEAEMFNLSSLAWDEFIATLSSVTLQPSSLDQFDDVLEASLDELLGRLSTARRAFFSHRDFGRVKREMFASMQTLLKLSAYVLGSLEGLDCGDDYGPRSRHRLVSSRFRPTFDALRQALREMASTYVERRAKRTPLVG